MKICPACKVELAPDAAHCPLCGSKAVDPDSREPHDAERHQISLIDPDNRADFNPEEKRTAIAEVVSVSALIAALSVAAVDLVVNRLFTWSPYPLAAIVFVWASCCVPLVLRKLPVLAAILVGLFIPGFLAALDAVDLKLDWFWGLGLPLAAGTELSVAAAIAGTVLPRRKGLNLISFWVFASAAVCLCVEIVLDLRFMGTISLHWSNIVAYALVPIGIFLLYLHYRIARTASLRKLFRV